MTVLRLIVLAAGLVVIAAIYLFGRRNRRSSANEASVGVQDAFVPQLDQPIKMRERSVDPPLTITSRDFGFGDSDAVDDLPPMHASDAIATEHPDGLPTTSVKTSSQTLVSRPILGDSPTSDMTTGAFIAAQSREPLTHELYEPSVDEISADRNAHIQRLDEHIGSPIVSAPVAIPATTSPQQTTARSTKKSATRKIVALRLSAGNDRVEGARLKSLLEATGLRHGKYSIYHRLHTDESSLFSVASMVEPGTFDVHAMSGIQFPGVTIFTQLPGPIDGSEMFSQMLACARELEQGIGGLLQDERGLPLTEQRAQRLREDVADFTHLLGQS